MWAQPSGLVTGLLLCLSAVPSLAFPQQTPAPTATTSKSSNTSCSASCTFTPLVIWKLSWITLDITTTLTAATVVLIVNNATNTTRTSTIYNELPSGYTLPDVNDQGTVQTTLTLSDAIAKTNYSTVVAFPTMYSDYPFSYNWAGTLETTATNGQPVCTTFSGAQILPSHPVLYQNSIQNVTGADQYGTNWGAVWREGGTVSNETEIFPDEAALRSCTPNLAGPIETWKTASFLTETSVSHEDSAPTDTPTTTSDEPPVTTPTTPTTTEVPPTTTTPTTTEVPPVTIPTTTEVPPVDTPTTTQVPPVDTPTTTQVPPVDTPTTQVPPVDTPTTSVQPPAPTGTTPSVVVPPVDTATNSPGVTPTQVTSPTTSPDSPAAQPPAGSNTVNTSPSPQPTGANAVPSSSTVVVLPPTITVGGQTITTNSQGQFAITAPSSFPTQPVTLTLGSSQTIVVTPTRDPTNSNVVIIAPTVTASNTKTTLNAIGTVTVTPSKNSTSTPIGIFQTVNAASSNGMGISHFVSYVMGVLFLMY